MQRALLVDEIIRHIFHYSSEHGPGTLNALARACRAWEVPALDCLWRRLSSIAPLLCLILGVELSNGIYVLGQPNTSKDLTRFHFYACRVKYIAHRQNVQVDSAIVSLLISENGAPTHPVALLPSLRSAHLTTSNCDIIQACLSLSNKLNRLDLDLGFKSKDSQSRNGYIYQYLQEVVRIAPGLQHLNIRGSIAENLLGLVSSMKNLHSLSLRLGSSLTTDVLVAVATFPNLSELEIHAGHLNPRNLSDTLRDSVLPTFPSLKVLRMRAHAPVLDVILAAILPDTLHTLRIEAEDPSGVPVAWNAIFANISCKAANTLQNLTIEHHLELDEMAIDDVTPSTDTTGSPAGPGEPKTDTPIPVNDLHVLRSLRHLKQFTLDTTLPPSLSDDDLDKMFNAWPQLENLDLGVSQASTPSRPREKAQSPTLLSLHALARRAPKLTTLITPMDIGNVAANAVPGDITPQHALTRMTLGCMPPSNKTDEVAKHLFRLFPSLAHLDGHPELEEGWGRIRHGLRSASAAL